MFNKINEFLDLSNLVFDLSNFPKKSLLRLYLHFSRQSLPKCVLLLNSFQRIQKHLVQIQVINCKEELNGLQHLHILLQEKLILNARSQVFHFQNHQDVEKESKKQIKQHDEGYQEFTQQLSDKSLNTQVYKHSICHQFQQRFYKVVSYEQVESLKNLDTNPLHIQGKFRLIQFQIYVPFLIVF